ncbi:hypothetical protein [Thalassotalea piscium]|uniref:Uncharacterized protein n=1 Tax=Thalassotalea piscium TaxID=1230533 RepID=A0A7X0NI35_9GAMM|nr:hypothetical protein [Thalassotalea piscium]MBB6543814.1 hypothetical protein [Thalassotalea piscium]
MTWLSKRLLVKQERQVQLNSQQLFLIKQAQQEKRVEIKNNFSSFATSLEGILTFTASGAVYELLQPTQSEQAHSKRESTFGSLQRWLFLAEKMQLF